MTRSSCVLWKDHSLFHCFLSTVALLCILETACIYYEQGGQNNNHYRKRGTLETSLARQILWTKSPLRQVRACVCSDDLDAFSVLVQILDVLNTDISI